MIDEALMAQVVKLSPADRLDLISAVWATLNHQKIAVTDAEKALLDERIADADANPDDESPWPEAKERLTRLLR